MQAEWDEDAIVNKLVAGCLAAERAPKPPVKPRAIIVVDERGHVTIRRRSSAGAWTVERFANVADATERQRQLMGG